MPEPGHDLAHIEILTDRFDETLDFFTRVHRLSLSGRDETSARLRARDDYAFRSLKLTTAVTVHIETGPHRHVAQGTFLPVWTQKDRMKGRAWGLKSIESFHTHGTPPLKKETA